MTSHQEILDRLDEFADGALSTEEARRVEEHLHGCASCREELNRLGRLLDQATALRSRPILPASDLWPEIRQRLGHPERRQPMTPLRRLAAVVGWGFARRPLAWSAAALLVAAGLAIFVFRGQEKEPAQPAVQVAGLSTLETEAARARNDYESALRERGGPLPVNAGSEFEKNLKLLDQAIADSRAAVEKDPRNQGLQRSLLAIYQKQLSLLLWATKILQQT